MPRKISHHGAHAGYDILFDYLSIDRATSERFAKLTRRLPEALAWRMRQMRPQNSGNQGLQAELAAIPWVNRGRDRLCHFIYGEDTYFFTPLWKRATNTVLASYHYPPARLCTRVSPAAVKTLNAVVLVGTNQVEYFEKFLSADQVFVVPHHVDSEYFQPGPNDGAARELMRIIFVGSCMRDFDTLAAVITMLADRKDICFDLVVPKEQQERFRCLPNVEVYSGISDERFLTLYQQSDLGVMPMTDCTANNAILEMMACGKAIVSTDVGGIRDYLDDDGALFFDKSDAEGCAQSIESLLENETKRRAFGKHNRLQVEQRFSLPVIAQRMTAVYRDIATI